MKSSLRQRFRHLSERLRPNVEDPGPRRLELSSRLSWARVDGGSGPVVSLTSHGPRIATCHLAVESIARGDLRPSRIVLWLDDREAHANLTPQLRRLRRRGLDIRLTENFGPHTKYYPFIESAEDLHEPLVTADDDTVYPRTWLSRLVQAHRETPDAIIAFRARTVGFAADGSLARYETWELSSGTEPSPLHFLTAVSGALHPPRLLRALRDRGRAFQTVCPRADDVWIHHTALRIGIPVRLVEGLSVTFPLIDGSQEQALWYTNLSQGGNDAQLAATFTAQDVALLRSARSI